MQMDFAPAHDKTISLHFVFTEVLSGMAEDR